MASKKKYEARKAALCSIECVKESVKTKDSNQGRVWLLNKCAGST